MTDIWKFRIAAFFVILLGASLVIYQTQYSTLLSHLRLNNSPVWYAKSGDVDLWGKFAPGGKISLKLKPDLETLRGHYTGVVSIQTNRPSEWPRYTTVIKGKPWDDKITTNMPVRSIGEVVFEIPIPANLGLAKGKTNLHINAVITHPRIVEGPGLVFVNHQTEVSKNIVISLDGTYGKFIGSNLQRVIMAVSFGIIFLGTFGVFFAKTLCGYE